MDHHSTKTGPAPREISDLPVEILEQVFKYLSSYERNAVRLVCKSWYEICCLPPLSKDEVLFCAGFYPLSDIYELLNRSERRFLYLKFERVGFHEGSTFWKNNGSKIRSIIFKQCQFHNNSFAEIVICCENLHQLSLIGEDVFTMPAEVDFTSVLAKVTESGVVRNNLRVLEILDIWPLGAYEPLKQLFSIFPRIKALGIDNYAMTEDGFIAVLNYLMVSTDRMEKLKLHLDIRDFSSDTRHRFAKTFGALKKLTKFSTSMVAASKCEDVDRSLPSEPLESLVCGECWTSAELVLLHLLHSHPTIKHVEIRSPDNFTFTNCLFRKLRSSRLKSCSLLVKGSFGVEDPDSPSSCFSSENRSTRLTFPSISVSAIEVRRSPLMVNTMPFFQYFQNIRCIEFESSEISYAELQTLLKYLTKLKSLILTRILGWNIYVDTIVDPEDAFNKLTDLEHLELENSMAFFFLKSLTPQSILTSLKYLFIDIYLTNIISDEIQEFFPDLSILADAAPLLEIFHSTINGHYRFDVMQLCSKLSRLRSLRWSMPVSSYAYTDEFFQKLFSICPSLHILFHMDVFRRTPEHHALNLYFYDVLNKKVMRVEDSSLWSTSDIYNMRSQHATQGSCKKKYKLLD